MPSVELKHLIRKGFQYISEKKHNQYNELIQNNPAYAEWTAKQLACPRSSHSSEERMFFHGNTKANTFASKKMVDFIDFKPGFNVLELGPGGGESAKHACLKLAQVGGGRYNAVDPSKDCLIETTNAINALEIDGNKVERILHNGFVHNLPFRDASIDVIFHFNCWYFWPDLAEGILECKRVLKPNGLMLTGSRIPAILHMFGPMIQQVQNKFKNLDLEKYMELQKEHGFENVTTEIVSGQANNTLSSFSLTKAWASAKK